MSSSRGDGTRGEDRLDWELLRALTEVAGPSGHEGRVAAIVEPVLAELCDEVQRDPLGGLVGRRAGNGGPRLMLAAHMDEIGLMVSQIGEDGFLRIIPLGGWDTRTLIGQRIMVHGREDVPGVVGTVPVHLLSAADRKKVPEMSDLAIDVGMPAERVRELVRPGDSATRPRELMQMGDLITGKSLDDRVGVYVMLAALRATGPAPAEVWAAATVQEEVGLRGARVMAGRVRPEIALAIDTCPGVDRGGGGSGPTTELGKGAAIRVMDASAIGDPRLVGLLTDLATERDIPHQFHVADRGGTDTRELQLAGDGAIAGCVSIPSRYVHSSVEVCHPDDIIAAVDLVAAAIEEIHRMELAN